MRIFLLSFILVLVFMFTGSFSAWQLPDKKTEGKPTAPNILFCIADDMSFRYLNAYHKTPWVSTPFFDRVAGEGVLFANAYTPNSKCAPSRACILTGRNPWQLEEAGNHVPYFPDKFVTWVETLGDHGYWTGYSGKGWAPGKVGNRAGFQQA